MPTKVAPAILDVRVEWDQSWRWSNVLHEVLGTAGQQEVLGEIRQAIEAAREAHNAKFREAPRQ